MRNKVRSAISASLPVAAMPAVIAVEPRLVSVRSISAITNGWIRAAYWLPVAVAVPRGVGTEIRKALSERHRCRSQQHRGSENECFHEFHLPFCYLLENGKMARLFRVADRTKTKL